MRLGLNGRFLSQRVTGVQRYAREVVCALDAYLQRNPQLTRDLQISLLAPPDSTLNLELAQIVVRRVGRLRGQLWEQLELPLHARGQALLSLANTAPAFVARQAVTIHDASVFAVPDAYSPAFRSWYRLMLPLLGRRARCVVTTSEFSRTELVRRLGVADGRIRVVPCGHEHILAIPPQGSILQRHGLGERPYVLAVSSLSRHKNLEAVYAAIRLLQPIGCDYVLAGPVNPRVFGSGLNAPPGIIRLGYVSDGELRALYENAACFVYPSRYEGFGLPPLEAMACGCPVIVARAASLPEVCGDAALYVDPDNPGELAAAIRRVLCEEGVGSELRHRGRQRAKRWTWTRSAVEMLEAVRETLGR
jgi:glycosyltransferase involved in cell wall biosynthesis